MMRRQDLGTAWMIQPVHKQHTDVAFDQLIGQMDLEDAKKYMCPISNGNPLKCLDCKGFATCGVGQHVVRLTDEMTRAFTPERNSELSVQKHLPVGLENDQNEFRKACESGNAWNYLMTTYQMSEGSAKEKIIYWINHYRSIANEFGGRKQILVKPKVVTIQNVPVTEKKQEVADPNGNSKHYSESRTIVAREKADALFAKANPIQWLIDNEGISQDKALTKLYNYAYRYHDLKPRYVEIRDKFADSPHTVSKSKGYGRSRCEAALASGDPIRFLIDGGLNRSAALQQILRWRKVYPDLMDGYENPIDSRKGYAGGQAVRDVAIAKFLECMGQSNPAEYYAKLHGVTVAYAIQYLKKCMKKYDRMDLADRLVVQSQEPVQTQDDEMSLEEFLNEFGNEMPEVNNSVEHNSGGTDDDSMRSGIAAMAATLDNERIKLVEQIDKMKQQIAEAEDRITTIERQLEGLNQAMLAFGGQQIEFEKRMMA